MSDLRKLAESCGVTTSHVDGLGQEVRPCDEAILAALRALGIPIEESKDAAATLADREARPPSLAPPCLAGETETALSVPLGGAGRYRSQLHLEDGSEHVLEGSHTLTLPHLPSGYHQVSVERGGERSNTHLLIAPVQRFGAPGTRRSLGLFAPLYAIAGEQDYGVGDFSGLAQLMQWASEQGVDFLGTLPLSAANYREDFQTSPYSPVSRLFWNEIYLDVAALAKQFPSEHLSELLEHPRIATERERLAELPLIDYKKTSELKSRLLYRIADAAWKKIPQALENFVTENQELHSYAAFRATMEITGTTYHHWPEAQRLGNLGGATYDEDDYRYHVFVQWAAEQQLTALSDIACELYLDLSVGAGGASYDVWRHQHSFVSGIDVGAPPDALFRGGQNWALPPLHPQRARQNGHEYFTECVRANMRHAGMLRIDHVMGLHRLYWVPSELGATEGLYVRYPAEELYAILRIEAGRNQCALVGEDLGTVPDSVRPAMSNAGMHRLFVGQFSIQEGGHGPSLAPAPEDAVASLNTHDTPTFAGWFEAADMPGNPEHLMKRWTESLATGPASAVVVTLEDLWLEVLPQNQPGTGAEEPNWRRRLARSLKEITLAEEPGAWLRHLRSLR